MPLTQHTASEISRIYLNSKLKMLLAFEEDKQLQEILESLEKKDFHLFNPEEKTKVCTALYCCYYNYTDHQSNFGSKCLHFPQSIHWAVQFRTLQLNCDGLSFIFF